MTYAVRSLPETPEDDKILVIDKRAAPTTLVADLEDRSRRLAMGHLLVEHRKTRQWPRMGQHRD